MKKQVLTWSRDTVKSPELRDLLVTLGEHYPIVENGNGLKLTPSLCGDGLRVSLKSGQAEVTGRTLNLIARGIGMLLSGTVDNNQTIEEETTFKTAGLMLDCCRNAVMKVDYLKEWLRRSALMGYNLMMLYTKDTYELPGEECFGYLRGRYTAAELKEIDAYAARLGIEMVGCIQALGHLEPVLRWPRYGGIKDTYAELLTTEEKSYELINKMLDFYGSVFKSRRIHLGMDETHNLGRGRYMDLNGYRRPFDIYIDHLNRVVGECNRRKLKPIIWSDMFFRMANKNMDYYNTSSSTPQDIIDKIPREVQLSYWDYYHKDREFYRSMIRQHLKLGSIPFMASGIWTWPVFWHNHRQTMETVRPCIEACRQEKVDEIVFTMWGDDGAFCDWSSALAGACYAAEKVFGAGEPGEKMLEKKFAAICNGSYKAHVIASEITHVIEKGNLSATELLWDDPLLGIYRKEQEVISGPNFWTKSEQHYRRLEAALSKYPNGGAGSIRNIRELIALLKIKIQANLAVAAAYKTRKKQQLTAARKLIAREIKALADYEKNFRQLWYARNKTFGYEVMQIRLAGQAARWRELDRRLQELDGGKDRTIPELEEKTVDRVGMSHQYNFLATASVYF